MGAGIPSGGADPVALESIVEDGVGAAEACERSEAVGETGRVDGGFTAIESVECAVILVRVDACELERKTLVANRGREELVLVVDVGTLGAIL